MRGGGFFDTLAAATLAAVLAIAGNYVVLRFQTRSKVREERRQFVRDLHSQTVDLVVDLDLFVRELRANVVGGTRNPAEADSVRAAVASKWEGDLLRRVRRARFGHPDPDVREAAELLEDEMWMYVTTAEAPDYEPEAFPPTRTPQERLEVKGALDNAMTELRRSVYAAPHRDVPSPRYSGEDIPSRFWRAVLEEERLKDEDSQSRTK